MVRWSDDAFWTHRGAQKAAFAAFENDGDAWHDEPFPSGMAWHRAGGKQDPDVCGSRQGESLNPYSSPQHNEGLYQGRRMQLNKITIFFVFGKHIFQTHISDSASRANDSKRFQYFFFAD